MSTDTKAVQVKYKLATPVEMVIIICYYKHNG